MNFLISSGGTNSAIVPEVWSAQFQENLRNAVVFNGMIRTDYEGEIKRLGDTVRIPTMEDVIAQDLLEGQKADTVAPGTGNIPLVINKRTVVDFEITDEAELQSIPHMAQLQERAFSAIQLRMQAIMIAEIAPSVAGPDHVIPYDNASTLADADLLEMLDLEKTANWPETGRHIVTGGLQYNDLLNIEKLYRSLEGGNVDIASGKITKPIYGHDVQWTNAAGSTTFAFHDTFMQAAVQKQLTMKLFDQGGQGSRSFRLNFDILWGVKQLFSDRVITIG